MAPQETKMGPSCEADEDFDDFLLFFPTLALAGGSLMGWLTFGMWLGLTASTPCYNC